MRKIALTMLLALWTLTCRASELTFKLCGHDAQTEIPSSFLSAVADYKHSPNCGVRFITPLSFDDHPCYESQFTLTSVVKTYEGVQLCACWLPNCFL